MSRTGLVEHREDVMKAIVAHKDDKEKTMIYGKLMVTMMTKCYSSIPISVAQLVTYK